MTELDPLVSPDGRFRWDGKRWVATTRQLRRSALLALLILGVVFGIPLLLLIAIWARPIIAMFRA
jgi:hypothetical protein